MDEVVRASGNDFPLVLSLFPGIGILDRGFEEEGFNVVRGPDPLWGGDIRKFHLPAGVFEGVIGGPPCQCFSRLVAIVRHNGYRVGENLIPEFERVVAEAQPEWFVMENVDRAPIPAVPGYKVHPSLLNNRWLGGCQSRLHRFSFGSRDGRRLIYDLAALESPDWEPRICASDWRRAPVALLAKKKPRNPRGRSGTLNCSRGRRDLRLACRLQGLPEDFFDHSPFTVRRQMEMLGNAVALPMARELARAIRRAMNMTFSPERRGGEILKGEVGAGLAPPAGEHGRDARATKTNAPDEAGAEMVNSEL